MSDLILLPNDLQASSALFAAEKHMLEKVLQSFRIQIEHIGSTALPNSIGKGILDVLLICESPKDQEMIRDELVSNGYIQGELQKIPDGRLFFVKITGTTEAGDLHLHVVVKNSQNLQSLIMRNYLLAHPEEIEEYNREKQRLAALTHNNRYEYAVQKAKYIEDLLNTIQS